MTEDMLDSALHKLWRYLRVSALTHEVKEVLKIVLDKFELAEVSTPILEMTFIMKSRMSQQAQIHLENS